MLSFTLRNGSSTTLNLLTTYSRIQNLPWWTQLLYMKTTLPALDVLPFEQSHTTGHLHTPDEHAWSELLSQLVYNLLHRQSSNSKQASIWSRQPAPSRWLTLECGLCTPYALPLCNPFSISLSTYPSRSIGSISVIHHLAHFLALLTLIGALISRDEPRFLFKRVKRYTALEIDMVHTLTVVERLVGVSIGTPATMWTRR